MLEAVAPRLVKTIRYDVRQMQMRQNQIMSNALVNEGDICGGQKNFIGSSSQSGLHSKLMERHKNMMELSKQRREELQITGINDTANFMTNYATKRSLKN